MNFKASLRRCSAWAFAILLVVAFTGTAPAAEKDKAKSPQQGAAGVAGAKYVGSEQCKICHEDQARMMQSTPHYRIFSGGEGAVGAEGCEHCHGAGSAHIDGGGDRSKISRLGGVKAEDISAICLNCHKDRPGLTSYTRSVHSHAGVACTDCHKIHRAKSDPLLAAQEPYICYTCHQEVKADFNKPFHHRVEEGLVRCSDCHNVHGSSENQLRSARNKDRVCYQCHSDKRGPFVYEHEPVRSEGCSTCHTPHGSANAHQLTRSNVNALCLECHNNLPSGPHPQNTYRQSCTLCHVQIHGSNGSSTLMK